MPTLAWKWVFALGSLVAAAGCRHLEMTRVNSDQAKPNNVWVFFTVQDGEEPVANLAAEDFEIYEDQKLVSRFESRQTIQNPDVAAVMYTLLLIDMSGSVTESGEASSLVDAATTFVQKVEQTPQKVGVFVFDGSEDIKSVVRFTEAQASVQGGLEGLRDYHAKDPSTNLNGAVVQGLAKLDDALQRDKRPLKFGTLVVFSDGTDRAGRVTETDMRESLADDQYEPFEVYAIGVGAELERRALEKIGRDGTEMADDDERVGEAFDRVASRIESQSKRFYLLSYCTPSRKGEHAVRIDASRKNAKGRKNGTGSLEYTFSAEGFGPPPQCDPERKPTFRLDKNLEPADPPDAKSDRSAERGGRASGRASANVRGPGSGD